MTNRTATAHAAPEHAHTDDALCAMCRLADGRRHSSSHDHLGAHGIDCACDCHEAEVQRVAFSDADWELAALCDQLILGACGARGPPLALVA